MLTVNKLSDIIGNELQLFGIQNMLRNHKYPKFTIIHGPQGTGKSSVAKMVAKSLGAVHFFNGASIPYSIEELDNNFFKTSPITPIVLLIDEFHAFADKYATHLLTMLDNIPNNVYLIGTTTELKGLNYALQSRATLFEFELLDKTHLKVLLDKYLTQLGINLNGETKEALIHNSRGIPRQLLKDVDLLISGEYNEQQALTLFNYWNEESIFITLVALKSEPLSFATHFSKVVENYKYHKVEQLREYWTRYMFARNGASNSEIPNNRKEQLDKLYSDKEAMALSKLVLSVTESQLPLALLELSMRFSNSTPTDILGTQIAKAQTQTVQPSNPITSVKPRPALSADELRRMSFE